MDIDQPSHEIAAHPPSSINTLRNRHPPRSLQVASSGAGSLSPARTQAAWPNLSTDSVHVYDIPSMQRPLILRGHTGNVDGMRHFDLVPGSPTGCEETSATTTSPRRHRAGTHPAHVSSAPYPRTAPHRVTSPTIGGIRSRSTHYMVDARPTRSPTMIRRQSIHLSPTSPSGNGPEHPSLAAGVSLGPLPGIRELNLPGGRLEQSPTGGPRSPPIATKANQTPPSPTSELSHSGSPSSSDVRPHYHPYQSGGSGRHRHRRGHKPAHSVSQAGPSSPSSRDSPAVTGFRLGSPAVIEDVSSLTQTVPHASRAAWTKPGTASARTDGGEQLRGRAVHHLHEERQYNCGYLNPVTGARCNGGRVKKVYDLFRHLGTHIKKEIQYVEDARLVHNPNALAPQLHHVQAPFSRTSSVRPPIGASSSASTSTEEGDSTAASSSQARALPEAPLLKALAGAIGLHIDWEYLQTVGVTVQTDAAHFISKLLCETCMLLICRKCDQRGESKAFSRKDVLKKHLADSHSMTLPDNDRIHPPPREASTFLRRLAILFGDLTPHVSVQLDTPAGVDLPPHLCSVRPRQQLVESASAAFHPSTGISDEHPAEQSSQAGPSNAPTLSSPVPTPYPVPKSQIAQEQHDTSTSHPHPTSRWFADGGAGPSSSSASLWASPRTRTAPISIQRPYGLPSMSPLSISTAFEGLVTTDPSAHRLVLPVMPAIEVIGPSAAVHGLSRTSSLGRSRKSFSHVIAGGDSYPHVRRRSESTLPASSFRMTPIYPSGTTGAITTLPTAMFQQFQQASPVFSSPSMSIGAYSPFLSTYGSSPQSLPSGRTDLSDLPFTLSLGDDHDGQIISPAIAPVNLHALPGQCMSLSSEYQMDSARDMNVAVQESLLFTDGVKDDEQVVLESQNGERTIVWRPATTRTPHSLHHISRSHPSTTDSLRYTPAHAFHPLPETDLQDLDATIHNDFSLPVSTQLPVTVDYGIATNPEVPVFTPVQAQNMPSAPEITVQLFEDGLPFQPYLGEDAQTFRFDLVAAEASHARVQTIQWGAISSNQVVSAEPSPRITTLNMDMPLYHADPLCIEQELMEAFFVP
ncbi:hypothetical protein BKA62DRAFT_86779 [Auriculariales sp. MPI-PUGE-AT-0066]|nr:hypothetical protein BKA62DRAFT_86779 [Auriculariales sp. MPI-PUGE-AT-0066]